MCWGDLGFLHRPPKGSFVQVSVGTGWDHDFACAIRTGGVVICWGDPHGYDNYISGQIDPPKGHFTQISAGFFGACGAEMSGAMVCWGEAQGGAMSGRFVQVAYSGLGLTCGLHVDGRIECYGQQSIDPWVKGRYRQVSVGYGHFDWGASTPSNQVCAVRVDGTAECWGDPAMTLSSVTSRPDVTAVVGHRGNGTRRRRLPRTAPLTQR